MARILSTRRAAAARWGSWTRARVAALRDLLASTGWVERTRDFAGTMRRSTRTPGGLLLVGTPDEEPWHLAAHLDDESRLVRRRRDLAHARALAGARRRAAAPVGHPGAAGAGRRAARPSWSSPRTRRPTRCSSGPGTRASTGATVLSLDGGDAQLAEVAHESLTVVEADLVVPELSFDSVQHLVSAAAGEVGAGGGLERARRSGFRNRLAHGARHDQRHAPAAT